MAADLVSVVLGRLPVVMPSTSPRSARRWVAAWTAGWSYLLLALCSTAPATLVTFAPGGVVETVAGLALLATLGSALAGAVRDVAGREAAVVTFLVAASGLSVFDVGSAFRALLVGLVVRRALSSKRDQPPTDDSRRTA